MALEWGTWKEIHSFFLPFKSHSFQSSADHSTGIGFISMNFFYNVTMFVKSLFAIPAKIFYDDKLSNIL